MVTHRVLIIGAGATGSVLAAELARRLRGSPLLITIWDKAKGAGGRMSTSRSCNDKFCRADIGAQYFSSKHGNELVNKFYEKLLNKRLLRKLELKQLRAIPDFRVSDDSDYFACTEGTSAIVKHFLNEACTASDGDVVKIFYNKKLISLSGRTEQSKMVWIAEAEDGEHSSFDSIITTMPVPQAVQILKNTSGVTLATDIISKLADVKYSSRYAVALFFRFDVPDSIKKFPLMKYYNDHMIRYASLCNEMRGDATDTSPPALVFHSTTKVGADNVHVDKAEAEKRFMKHLRTTLEPNLPYDYIDDVKFHRWLYSQVEQPYTGTPGFVVVSEQPLLICAGDGFTSSNFDGCLESAVKSAEFFCKRISA